MKNIQEIKVEYEKVKDLDDGSYIKFYEANIDSINNIDPTLDEDHYNAKLRLQSEYGLSLAGAGYYSKSIPVIEDSILMFESLYQNDTNKLHTISFFEILLFNLGRASWEIKDNAKATKSFERLVKNYPKNERYRSWMNGLKAERIKKLVLPFWILCVIWFVGDLTLFRGFESSTRFALTIIGSFLLAITVLSELYIYRVKRKRVKA